SWGKTTVTRAIRCNCRRSRLKTLLGPDKLERRLTKIFREERTLEEEQGLSTLFLALGFLKWFDSDQAEESFAPLVLVPVTMMAPHSYDETVRADAREGDIGTQLGEIAKANPGVAIGGSPFFDPQHGPNTNVVLRARDAQKLAQTKRAVEEMLE